MAAKSKQNKRQPIGVEIRRMLDPKTRKPVLCFVAAHDEDRELIKARGFREGDKLSADITKDRNPEFWRLAHVLGGWLCKNTELFSTESHHSAIKRLQVLANVGCEDVGLWHKELSAQYITRQAKSLNFGDMDEGEFRAIWHAMVAWLRVNLWGSLTDGEFEQVERIILGKYFEDWRTGSKARQEASAGV